MANSTSKDRNPCGNWIQSARKWILTFTAAASCIGAASSGAPVPLHKPPTYPDWWFTQEVVVRTNPSNSTPDYAHPGDYPIPDDFALLTQGQLKKFALAARDEMNAKFIPVGGAGPTINTLVNSWLQLNLDGTVKTNANGKPIPRPIPGVTDDSAIANLGQLKAVAHVFYSRFIQLHYANADPWSESLHHADDFAAANVGQAKSLFGFDPSLDSDEDELPDMWEVANGLDPFFADDALESLNMDGFTNLYRFQHGQGLNDPYYGRAVILTLVSGGGQWAEPNSVLPNAIFVRVTFDDGLPASNKPVLFSTTKGKLFTIASIRQGSKRTIVRTNDNGIAAICYRVSATPGEEFITASASTALLSIGAMVNYDTLPLAPSNLHLTSQDGQILVEWQNNATDAVSVLVERSTNQEDWDTIAILPPDTNTYTDVPSGTVWGLYYRIVSTYDTN